MFLYQLFVWRQVYAVNFVACHVAVDPLDAGSEAAEDAAGLLRDLLELRRAQLACARNFPFDHELRHVNLPRGHRLGRMVPAPARPRLETGLKLF